MTFSFRFLSSILHPPVPLSKSLRFSTWRVPGGRLGDGDQGQLLAVNPFNEVPRGKRALLLLLLLLVPRFLPHLATAFLAPKEVKPMRLPYRR